MLGFEAKMALMNEEVFQKEQGAFIDFIRTLAMNVGSLYKEDQIAKLMNISRRKVKKYNDILLKYNIITPVEPFVEDPQ
jgi:predicted AAA+ superfamily ATPase